MNIIFKQDKLTDISGSLTKSGISNCYFKKLNFSGNLENYSKKEHHHTFFELHTITEGCQTYEIDSKKYTIKKGEYLIIFPSVPHICIGNSENTVKYSITFNFQQEKNLKLFRGTLTERQKNNIEFITKEATSKKEISRILIENTLLELIVSFMRSAGFKEKTATETEDENSTVLLAKQYIKDNIENSPTVMETANYCGFSTKQLTRIFKKTENLSPGEYIKNLRLKIIEKLLEESTLSLKEISERMNFSSEYYFNLFVKQNAGMPPGEYRKTFNK